MQQTLASRPVTDRAPTLGEIPGRNEAQSSGISWAAVAGGAFVAAALSLILISLGAGFGFSVVSPWANSGASPSTVGGAAVAWLIVTQILASALGGYLAGRLRTKWVQVHSDEVYFRDTAHGLLVWAVGLVVTASLLTTAVASLAGTATTPNGQPADHYFVDSLLRSTNPIANDTAQRAEVSGIFAHALAARSMAPSDEAYLSQLVSTRTGLSKPEADKRVEEIFADAQQTADRIRKSLAHLSLWIFVALLSGAFCASYAATIGGRQRDHVTAV